MKKNRNLWMIKALLFSAIMALIAIPMVIQITSPKTMKWNFIQGSGDLVGFEGTIDITTQYMFPASQVEIAVKGEIYGGTPNDTFSVAVYITNDIGWGRYLTCNNNKFDSKGYAKIDCNLKDQDWDITGPESVKEINFRSPDPDLIMDRTLFGYTLNP